MRFLFNFSRVIEDVFNKPLITKLENQIRQILYPNLYPGLFPVKLDIPFFLFPAMHRKLQQRSDAGTGLTQFIATKISCVAISSRRLTGSRRDEDTRQAAALIGDQSIRFGSGFNELASRRINLLSLSRGQRYDTRMHGLLLRPRIIRAIRINEP